MRLWRRRTLLWAALVVVAGLVVLAPSLLHSPVFPPRHLLPVLSCATRGRWVEGVVTQEQRLEMYELIRHALDWQTVPFSLQREDGLCGNVTYRQNIPNTWLRALCNPTGPTPCCHSSRRCEARSRHDCRCPTCLDLRNDIIPEYSTWHVEEPNCRLVNWSRAEACSLLEGATLVFLGESLMRHMHTALLMLLSGNPWDGALVPGVSKEIRGNCTGMLMFTEKLCRSHVLRKATLCDGSVNVHIMEYHSVAYAEGMLKTMRSYLGIENLYWIVGLGLHDNGNASLVFDSYVKPLLELTTGQTRKPRVVWMGAHGPGLFKTPDAARFNQDAAGILRYTTSMREKLRPYGVPVLDALNLTRGVVSFDGTHTGMAVNLLECHMLLTHIMETKTRA